MHPRALLRRRPSASLLVSFAALFVALGGVGYAATQLPSGSVGSSQLQNGSVTNHKIANGAVGNFKLAFGAVGPRKLQNGAIGKNQIDPNEVQARVTGTCAGGQAMGSVGSSGSVACVPAAPKEFGTSSHASTVTGTTTPTQIASETLPSGSPFLVFAVAYATVTPGASVNDQWVQVSCTLAPGGTGNPQTSTATTHVTTGNNDSLAIPITVPTGSASATTTASVSCTESHASGNAPTVSVSATISAIQTTSNS